MTTGSKFRPIDRIDLVDWASDSSILRFCRWAILLACIARLWITPLPSSFWVDELVTVFVVQHPNHPSFAIAPQVPASIYYRLPRITQETFGLSEISYRFPSVLLMGVALFFIGRLASRLINPDAGWFAVFACLGLHGINDYAVDARPYAMGICVAAAALFFLVRWLDSVRFVDGVMFAALAICLLAVHLVYWPIYLVFAFYSAVRIFRSETRVTPWQAIGLFGVVSLAVVPQIIAAFHLLRYASDHVVAALPGVRELQHAIRWNLALICGGAAWLTARLVGWAHNRVAWANSSLMLIWAWWLGQPGCLFVFSRITGDSVFVERYLSIALPGAALAATAAASICIPDKRWRIASTAFGVGVFIVMGQWTVISIRHGHSDWRAASQEERRLANSVDIPVICPSPFIEARAPLWYPTYPLPGFLYAHLSGYPVAGKIYLLPFGAYASDGESYARYLTENVLAHSRRFEIYGATKFWQSWFAAQPELVGWSNRLESFGDILLAVFDNPGQPTK
jgi:hypothetical protein